MLSCVSLFAVAVSVAVVSAGRPIGSSSTHEFLPTDGASDSDGPAAHAWAPDGSVVLVAHEVTGDVSFLGPDLRARVEVGAGPLDIKIAATSGLALVPNSLDDTLSIIDVDAATLVSTIPLSGAFPYQVNIASDGSFALVACGESDSVSVVDLGTLTEVRSFSTDPQGAPLHSLTSSLARPGTRIRYAKMDLARNDQVLAIPGDTAVVVYDVATGAEVSRSGSAYDTVAVAFGESSRYLGILAADFFGAPQASVLDIRTGSTHAISLCADYYDCPYGVGAESFGVIVGTETAIVASGDRVLFLDLESAALLHEFPNEGSILALSGDGRIAFTAGADPSGPALVNRVSVLDTAHLAQLAVLETPWVPDQLAVHPSGRRVSGLGWHSGEQVEWFEWTNLGLTPIGGGSTGSPPEGDGPNMVVSDASGRLLLTSNARSRNLTLIDRDTGTRSLVELESVPRIVDMDDAGKVAAVAYSGDHRVAIVDLELREVVAHVDAFNVIQLAVSADGKSAYAAGLRYANSVSLDGLHVIKLAGADTHEVTTLRVHGFSGSTTRRMPVSCDEILAIPRRHGTDKLTLVDGRTAAVIADIDLPGPRAVAFSPDGRTAFALSGNGVSRIRIDGPASAPEGHVEISHADKVFVSSDGRFVFVTTRYANPVRFVVVDAESLEVRSEVTLAGLVHFSAQVGHSIFLRTSTDGNIQRVHVDHAGQATVLDPLIVSSTPLDLYSGPESRLYAVSSFQDGLDVMDFSADLRLRNH